MDAETARLRAGTRGGFVGNRFSAPLAGATRGRLVFTSGAPRFALNVAPLGGRANARIIAETSASRLEFAGAAPGDDLVLATFDGPRPDVRAAGGVVTIRYRRQATAAFSTRKARLALNGSIPWTIELDGGITDLTGSLEAITLERMDVDGGANHVRLDLPRPAGTATVRIGGVVSSARFKRPAGIPVAVRMAGGVAHLKIDGGRREQVAGNRRYVGPGFAESPDRYELEVLGGASELRVSSGPPAANRTARHVPRGTPGRIGCQAARNGAGGGQASSFALAAANSSSERTPALCSWLSWVSWAIMASFADGAAAGAAAGAGAGSGAGAAACCASYWACCCSAAWFAYFVSWWWRTAPAVPATTAVVAAIRTRPGPRRRIM